MDKPDGQNEIILTYMTLFLFDTKKLKIRELGCLSQRCQTSAEVDRHAVKKA